MLPEEGAAFPDRNPGGRPGVAEEHLSHAEEGAAASPVCAPAEGVHAVSGLSYGAGAAVRADDAPEAELDDEDDG